MTRCRSCQAPVRWVRMQTSGRSMPLDPDPHPDGNVAINDEGQGVSVKPRYAAVTGEPVYRSHFASCPDAGAHRKDRAA